MHAFNIITGKNEPKMLTKDISCKCKCKFHVINVIQIKSRITITVDADIKNIIYVRKIIFRVLLHVVAKMVSIWQLLLMIQWLRVMILLKKQKQFQ